MSKLRTNTHWLPIELEVLIQTAVERICALSYNGIGDQSHYLLECEANEIIGTIRSILIMPFYETCKGIKRLPNNDLCRAILACQNSDLLTKAGHLCLKKLEAYVNLALCIPMNHTKVPL